MFAFAFAYMCGCVHVRMHEREHECINAQVHVRTYVAFVTCRSKTDGHTYQIQEVKKEIAELSYMMRMGQVSLSCCSLEWLAASCMHVCMHTCMHELIDVGCIHVFMYACMEQCMYVCANVCMYIRMYV